MPAEFAPASPQAEVPRTDPLMIVVGGDALALSTASEICSLGGHRVVVLWPADAEFARAVERVGAVFVAGRPESGGGLERAGVGEAVSILALSRDEQLNLQTALRARDTNPRIRIVLRQFNRTLAAKIEQNLPNCSVLSLAWHSAATYAAAALDASCSHGLQFPEPDGPLTGFARRTATAAEVAGRTVAQVEHALAARIVAINGDTAIGRDDRIADGAELVVYGRLSRLLASAPRPSGDATAKKRRRFRLPSPTRRHWRRIDKFLAGFIVAVLTIIALGAVHFHSAFDIDWLTAIYFVLTTMTTTGYGDLTPSHNHTLDILAALALMLSGVTFTGIFFAFGASRLTRAQWVRMQGLRRVRRRGHIVVCGAGSIGSGVIDLLLQFDKPLVVIEVRPDTALGERARDLGFDLLTGDASRDDTLDLCNLEAAHSLVALTNVDTLNLEIALGARARNPDMPVVLRIAEAGFAASIASHFDFKTTFSVAALAAPTFAGMSRIPGARGRIVIDGREFAIGEISLTERLAAEPPPGAIPLAVADGDDCRLIRDLRGIAPGTRVLLIVPLTPFRDGSESLAAVIERILGG